MEYPKVCLRRGETLAAGCCWIYDNEIDWADDTCEDGGLVEVLDSRMRYQGTGFFNRRSKITVRLVSRERGETIDRFPYTPDLYDCEPVYETLPGWKSDVRGITEWDKLPENCRKYVEFIEKEIEVPVRMLSTGPKRSEVLYRK